MMRKKEKVRLIDDAGFAVQRVKVFAAKPDGWFRSPKHLAYVRTLRCACCGEDCGQTEAAHVRKGTDGAAGEKPSDFFVVPLTRYCHARQHQIGEPSFWQRAGVPDPILRALEIAMASPCIRTRAAAMEEWKRRYDS